MEIIQYSEYHSVSNYQVISTFLHSFIVNHYQEMSGSNLTKNEKRQFFRIFPRLNINDCQQPIQCKKLIHITVIKTTKIITFTKVWLHYIYGGGLVTM